MLQTLRAARWSGYLRSDVDLPVLADRIVQTMLQVGLDVIRHNASADKLAELLCRILLEGLAAVPPTDAELDRSAAFIAADAVVQSWADDSDAEADDKAAHVRAVARAEFGRKGYEVHDHPGHRLGGAARHRHGVPIDRLEGRTAGLDHAVVRREGGARAGRDVLRSDSSPIEKLDALSWVNTNALDRFGDEFRIQLAWMRQSPPDTPNPGWLFAKRVRQMKTLLAEGIRSGEITIDSPSNEMLARSRHRRRMDPGEHPARLGHAASLIHVRDTMLRGVAD